MRVQCSYVCLVVWHTDFTTRRYRVRFSPRPKARECVSLFPSFFLFLFPPKKHPPKLGSACPHSRKGFLWPRNASQDFFTSRNSISRGRNTSLAHAQGSRGSAGLVSLSAAQTFPSQAPGISERVVKQLPQTKLVLSQESGAGPVFDFRTLERRYRELPRQHFEGKERE